MKVLVVGSGGREHALCTAIKTSPDCTALYCAPGNAGIGSVAALVPIPAENIDALIDFVRREAIDFVVVGPEAPLVGGLVDRLEAMGVRAFGPSQAAARLEGSKGFMKDFCARHGLPTAAYGRFRDAGAAKAFCRARGAPIVIKADGLAAGKGVTIAQTLHEAEAAIDAAITEGRFGEAGAEVVVEEFLVGEEASFLALVDGKTALPLASAQDHKAVGDGDTGPNTGGMGAYSPAPVVTEAMAGEIMARIIRPTVAGMAAEGAPFKGILYAGVMVTKDGPKLLEFNVRFGDPECQVLLVRLESDLLAAMVAASEGRLEPRHLRWGNDVSLCVVMAARGYPGAYAKGTEIRNLDRAGAVPGVTVFHAGTESRNGRVVSIGGRVLGVTARAATVAEAQRLAYRAVDLIDWPDGFCRRDIGWRAIARGA